MWNHSLSTHFSHAKIKQNEVVLLAVGVAAILVAILIFVPPKGTYLAFMLDTTVACQNISTFHVEYNSVSEL